MDIWAWVDKLYDELTEAGQERVAEMLYSLPNLACEDKLEQAEALFPEALAAARALKNPWMEVFFRHWHMRLRLRTLAEGEVALPEAVSLLEFAHRKECADCPQSVCTTQDIAACYGYVDGPGWAEERKAVCEETLARIDPTWNCYICLSAEYADALSDQDAYEQALAYLREAMRTFAAAGKEVQRSTYCHCVSLLHRAGRFDDALRELDRVDAMTFEMEEDDSDRLEADILRARLLAAMGRYDEASEILPDWSDVIPGDYAAVLEAHYHIASQVPEKNTWQLGGLFQEATAHMHRVQAHRQVIQLAEWHARLALLRGATETARRALRLMEEHLPKLRAPLGADALLAELRAAITTAPPLTLPVPAHELPEYLRQGEDRNPEQELELLRTALAELPDDAGLATLTASALRAMSAESDAQALLWETMERFPHLAEALHGELIDLIPARDTEPMARLAALLDIHAPELALWTRAHIAFRAEQWAEAGNYLTDCIAARPKATGARRFRAEIAMRAKDFTTAVQMRQEVIARMREREEDPVSDQWDLLVAASADQNWALVRQTCIEMGFDDVEPGDAPFEDEGSWVRIRYHEDGDWQEYVGVRTGPATARITEVSVPGSPQHAGDRVVFEPSPLEPEPEDGEERNHFMTPYHHVHTLTPGGFTAWILDGPDPDMEEWTPFRDALEEKGCLVWVCSGRNYRINDPDAPEDADMPDFDEENSRTMPSGDDTLEDGEIENETDDASDDEAPDDEPLDGLPGIYVAIGAPSGMQPKELDRLLTALTKTWKRPVSWLALAKAAGGNEKRHKKIIEQYGL